jgi:hypothetical protein
LVAFKDTQSNGATVVGKRNAAIVETCSGAKNRHVNPSKKRQRRHFDGHPEKQEQLK